MPGRPICRVVDLGLIEFLAAWDLQVELARKVAAGKEPNTLLLLEHPPVYTLGRRSQPEHLKLPREQLARMGIAVHETDRGGQATFHGPGQLVAYPVVNLRGWGGPVQYVRALEQVILRTLGAFGLKGELIEGLTGVWVGNRKIAAIGVKISQGVAFHGLALNVEPDLSYFDHIVPCGITDKGVTSMAAELGRPVSLQAVAPVLAEAFCRHLGFQQVNEPVLPALR